MPEDDRYPECFDSYLRYAISTDFKNVAFLNDKSLKLFFLVGLKKAGGGRAFEEAMMGLKFDVELGPNDDDSQYTTLRAGKEAVLDRRAFAAWNEYVSRVELSLPVKPSLEATLIEKTLVPRWQWGNDPPASLLIGVLDDGCPFAAAHFLRTQASGVAGTRVRGIWDQNVDKQPIQANGTNGFPSQFGQTPPDFSYGLEFHRESSASAGAPPQLGLDEWIQLHTTTAGSIDEDGCYADAKFSRLMGRQSHGAHVMDVFAGRVPTSARVGPSQSGQDNRDPPNWQPGKADTDPACSADMVFVQFQDDCIRDATGVWLKAYVFEGIQYILSFAHPTMTRKVVINLSYGPTTGSHDGTALLETALLAFVRKFNGTPGKPKLEIVLPVGNAYLSEGHVMCIRPATQPDVVEWIWRLPPDNAVLCFAELWMANADAPGVTVSLTSPSGVTFTPTPPVLPGVDPPTAGVDVPRAQGQHTMWLLHIEPTICAAVAAEHGDWTIKVAGIGEGAQLDAYVARSDPNMGVRSGARRSSFVDAKWQQTRSAQCSCDYADGEFDMARSLVRRDGTLNGIASAVNPSVHVAGGYILANGRKSSYSSAGPARSGPLALRSGPDFVLLCDESCALKGLRAGGNRSGAVFRLIGTSAAAPQLARHVTKPTLPPATDVPATPAETGKRGGGNLEPP